MQDWQNTSILWLGIEAKPGFAQAEECREACYTHLQCYWHLDLFSILVIPFSLTSVQLCSSPCTEIQLALHSCVQIVFTWRQPLSWAGLQLEALLCLIQFREKKIRLNIFDHKANLFHHYDESNQFCFSRLVIDYFLTSKSTTERTRKFIYFQVIATLFLLQNGLQRCKLTLKHKKKWSQSSVFHGLYFCGTIQVVIYYPT